MPLATGDHVGRYRVEAQLGKGGMGEVYRALDTELGREVALKVIADKPDDAAVLRFRREAQAASRLHHPNVATVFDVGVHEGSPYLVMELLDGSPLRRFVGDPSVSSSDRLGWLLDVASALEAAHDAGLVHRDVKPDNVIVTESGQAKLVDFGIARPAPAPVDPSAPTAMAEVALTRDGTVIGTPAYMAPEQLRGEPVDTRADQFAWGVTAFELLSGKLPWGAASSAFAVAAQIMNEDARDVRALAGAVDEGVADVVKRALARAPGDRFSSMKELREALSSAASGPAREEPHAGSARAPAKRRPSAWPVLVGAGVVLALGTWMLVGLLDSARAQHKSVATAGAPILGLSDKATREREAALHTLVPKTAASARGSSAASTPGTPPASASEDVRRCEDATAGCAEGSFGWCTSDGKRAVCCGKGLVGNAAGRCECAPGGTLDGKLIEGGCKRGPDDPATPLRKLLEARRGELQACYDEALARTPKLAGSLKLRFLLSPSGRAYGVTLTGATIPDSGLQDCAVKAVSEIEFPPPLDGFMDVTYPFDFKVTK